MKQNKFNRKNMTDELQINWFLEMANKEDSLEQT